jgi:hypothetical protein
MTGTAVACEALWGRLRRRWHVMSEDQLRIGLCTGPAKTESTSVPSLLWAKGLFLATGLILIAGVPLLMMASPGALPFIGLANCCVGLAGVRLLEKKAGQASGQPNKAAALACDGETALGVSVAADMAALLCVSLLLLTL